MADLATAAPLRPPAAALLDKKMKKSHAMISGGVVLAALVIGLGFIGFNIAQDFSGVAIGSIWPYLLLIVALLIALGFEFVNGFHDTANAVATVIYTHSLDPNIAVVWSGLCNLTGVLLSSGAVAFAIITLLPVELILQVSSGAGFAMVFALLIAAILWNLGTWWFGLPASSSHTMVGSIIGVGMANQLMSVHTGTSGVDWEQATKVFKVLLISPLDRLRRRRSAAAALQALHPHQVGQELCRAVRCEPQKAPLGDSHHRNYRNSGGIPLHACRAAGLRTLRDSGNGGRGSRSRLSRPGIPPLGMIATMAPGGHRRAVLRGRVRQNRHRECRRALHGAQRRQLLHPGRSAPC